MHQLLKERYKDIEPYNKRTSELDIKNELVLKLVQSILSIYGTKYNTSTHGIFNQRITKQNSFPLTFSSYFNQKKIEFYDLSINVMEHLQDKASYKAATGGYIFFAEYTIQGVRFLLIAMIKQKPSYSLSNSLDPEIFETLDLSRLSQAAKINFDRYKKAKNKSSSEDDNKEDFTYLSFISPSSAQSMSGYFITALGCQKGLTAAKMTNNVVVECTSFFKNDPLLKNERLKFRSAIIDYLGECQEKSIPAKLSSIQEIAKRYMSELKDEKLIDTKSKELLNKLNSDDIGISSEFNVNKSALDKFRKVSYKSKSLSFNFDANLLGENVGAKIYYSKKSKSLTIKNLDEDARNKIEEALRQNTIDDSDQTDSISDK